MPSKEEVHYIAHLARIHLQDEEVERLSRDLERILEYIEKLKELDVEGIKPTSHVLPLKNVFREDAVRPSLAREDIMHMAVDSLDGAFKVPKVIE